MHVFFFFFTPKTKMVQVSRDMLLCLLMAISASLTDNLTIGLLLWVKQKRQTGLFALSSKSVMPEQEFHSD